MSPRKLKLASVLGGLVVSGVILIAWTQAWFTVQLLDGPALEIRGDVAAPAQLTLALTGLTLFAALSIAGRVFRVILGLLASAIGALVALGAIRTIIDPITASLDAITEATAVAGVESTRDLVDSVSATAWPVASIVASVALVLLGILIAVSSRLWPASTRKYQAVRLETEDGSAVGSWDALSEGTDPTSR